MGDMSFFRLDENTMFSQLKDAEIQEVLRELDGFYIPYCETLGLDAKDSFGFEIEYKGAPRKLVDYFVNETMRDYRSNVEWASIDEPALIGGGEVTSKILHDEKETWLELKSICEFLKNNKSDNLVKAGGHVHVGARILGDAYDNWRRFIKMYAYYENILYRFGAGDKINVRENVKRMAQPIAGMLISRMWRFQYGKSMEAVLFGFPFYTKYLGVNMKHVHFGKLDDYEGNTIEFRFPNATTEEIIWQNYARAFVNLIHTSTHEIDEDFLDSKIHEEEYRLFDSDYDKKYTDVCLKQALCFADMIFSNNFDKACFLKQYIKGFQTTNETDLVLARRFIK